MVKVTVLAVTKISEKKKINLRMKGLLETHSMVVEAWIQEHEAAGHTLSVVRKQRKPEC